MRVVKPVNVTSSMLVSNIPQPDSAVGEIEWSAGTYALGTRRILISTRRVYEVVADPGTNDDPLVGAAKVPPTWLDVGPTNRFAMFDQLIGTATIADEALSIEIAAGRLVNSVAGFGISGVSSVTVTINDPADGEVYSRDVAMLDNSAIVDYYDYFFGPIVQRTDFVLLDLPAYTQATVKVDFAGDTELKVGALIVGQQINLGVTEYGTGLGLMDFSRKERDDFGNFIIVPRRNSKTVDFNMKIQKGRVGFVYNTLSDLTTVPAVYVGTTEQDDSTLVFGYYRDVTINIDSPSICSATLQVESVI